MGWMSWCELTYTSYDSLRIAVRVGNRRGPNDGRKPRVLGDYVSTETLGAGSMGKVKLATHTPTGQRGAGVPAGQGPGKGREQRYPTPCIRSSSIQATTTGSAEGSVARKGLRLWFREKEPPASVVVTKKNKDKEEVGNGENAARWNRQNLAFTNVLSVLAEWIDDCVVFSGVF
ncbi:hypothetical protein FRC12_015490 [Ceratobasidium sp. 428]|nr:hypothetical protein FRC12_015490 [Ceratobasidium sp. 428]